MLRPQFIKYQAIKAYRTFFEGNGRIMPLLPMHNIDGYNVFDEEECAAAGLLLHEQYTAAEPFPHIVIDDFLDKDILKLIASQYPSRAGKSFFDRPQERLKYQYHAGETSSATTRNILAELNSRAFLKFLKNLTGITGLIADPYFEGGGLHETRSGGHLSVHADFNIHGKMKVERRLNLLVYLNEGWSDSFGGHLELWDKEMTNAVHRISPLLGRAVIFNTSLDSFHGQPDPITCPENISRKSIATYYYTTFSNQVGVPKRTTNFRPRPATTEKIDRKIAFQHFVNDCIPPRLQKYILKINPFQ
jgi:Rps23 Pro-64 3,4-dihydroxylase Tpa1-like proline 4-hydroxylase